MAIIFITSYIISKDLKESTETVVREFYALGTIILLTLDGKNGEKAIQEAIDRLNIGK